MSNVFLSLFANVQVPRAEAMSLLGSLLCFQNLLQEIPVLDPNSEDLNVVKCSVIKVNKECSKRDGEEHC